jgi:hypothetical protein
VLFICSCAPDWESRDHTVYTIYWFLAGFLFPLSVILYTSGKTLFHLRHVSTGLMGYLHNPTRVARWYIFKQKIPIWVNFGGPLNGKFWYILCPFGI